MNELLISKSVTDALGWTLLHAIWQGFALVLPVAIVLHALRNRSSAVRYRVGVAGLLAQVLASVVTFGRLYEPAVMLSATSSLTGVPVHVEPMHWQTLAQPTPWLIQVQQFLAAHLNEFVLIYMVGVVVFALRLAGGWLYLQRMSRNATAPVSNRLISLTESLREAMRIKPMVQLRESARIVVPMVVGVLKPVLLLPIGLAANLSAAEVEAVLAHELAHVKRHDYAVNLLQSVVEVLYFFHPALWWLSARVREEREHCCDDLAVQTTGGNGRVLARALACIEELRLAQLTSSPLATPALAMSLTNKRQLLLHRVRRVLGAPTRPFISNGSLAGLTIMTLILLSASVYAVQQPMPKAKMTQPKPTRRHKVIGNTEFGLSDNKKLDYVIWKGKKLPALRVANLQKLYDQVMAGQLNVDDVKQPDRDILLQIIEVNYSFGKGVNGLNDGLNADLNADLNAQGSARIDYNTIMKTALDAANSAGTFSVDVDDVLESAEKIDYNSIISQAMATVSKSQFTADSIVEPSIADIVRRQDSLLNLQDLNKGKVALLKAKAQIQEFKVDAIDRKIEQIDRQKYILDRQRSFETLKQRRAISESGYAESDSARRVLMKQIEIGETAIRKIEADIEKMNQQLIDAQIEREKAQEPLRQMETELRKLRYSDYQAFAGPDAPAGVSRLPKPARAPKAIVPIHPAPAAPTPRPAPKP